MELFKKHIVNDSVSKHFCTFCSCVIVPFFVCFVLKWFVHTKSINKKKKSLDGWGCEGRRPISLSTPPIPLESEALVGSCVSIFNLSTSRKVLSLLRSMTGLHPW